MTTQTKAKPEASPHTQPLFPEQDVRKIPVARFYCDHAWPDPNDKEMMQFGRFSTCYGIVFEAGSKSTYRKEFAALRKALKEYKQVHPHAYDGRHCTTGEEWALQEDLLSRFAPWMEFPDPLETLIEQAMKQYWEQKREQERREKEEEIQYYRDLRAKRIPCPTSCKIRVLAFDCEKEEMFGEGFRTIFDRKGSGLFTYKLQLAESTTPEEQETFELFCKALYQEKHSGKTAGGTSRDYQINGGYRNWSLHEYVVLQYSEWLAFPDQLNSIEDILARKKTLYETRKYEEEKRRWEAYSRTGGQTWTGTLSSRSRKEVYEAMQALEMDISPERVKKQYRKLAMRHHPDTGGDAEQFKRVHDAYQTLLEWVEDRSAS